MAFSGGSTPALMFAVLAELDVPWGRHVYQVDERVAPDGDPDRNRLARRPPAAEAQRAADAGDGA